MAGNPSFKKRQRERARQERRREKERRRHQRRHTRPARAQSQNGEDPDLAGIVPGMQPWQLEAAEASEDIASEHDQDTGQDDAPRARSANE